MTKRLYKAAAPRPTPTAPAKRGISSDTLARAAHRPAAQSAVYTLAQPTPGVVPKGEMAMDSDPGLSGLYGWAGGLNGYGEGISFMGYPALSELAQRPEYRRMVGTLAQEMTRKWIKLTSRGDEDKTDKLHQLDTAMKRFRVQDVFREAAEHDGFFGRGQIYVDTGDTGNPVELATPLKANKNKIQKGDLKGLRCVEPIWTYPAQYNTNNPLAADFYKPTHWYVMGQKVHHTRLLTLISREVPDMLKPAYAFSGISLTQLAKPYVDNWLSTRKNVGDILESFTIWVLKSNLSADLEGGDGEQMALRAQLFNQYKSSRGLMMVDKESEDLTNVSIPLGSLDKLQAQSQEHMASVDGMPLVKLLGITPSGLNATAEPELQSWNERVMSICVHIVQPVLHHIIEIIQLSEFGEIDPDIGFEWNPLDEIGEKESADIRKTEADTDVALIGAGVILPDEARARLANHPGSGYNNLDLNRDLTPQPDDQETDEKVDGDKPEDGDTE